MNENFADGFTDEAEAPVSGIFDEEYSPTPTPVPQTTPVYLYQEPVADETGSFGLSNFDTGIQSLSGVDALPENLSEGQSEVTPSAEESQASQDYAELLAELKSQSEQLTALVSQTEEMSRQLTGIYNALPVLTVMLGIAVGVLLVHIFSAYFRP